MASVDPERPENAGPQGDHSEKVADHYNKLQETGLAARTQSRIFYLRNFNNWMKSMAISDVLTRLRKDKGSECKLRVLDLCSGKGGDLLKWRKGRISSLVCADIAATSVEQCESRFKEMLDRAKRERYPDPVFSAQFVAADCTKVRLKEKYDDPTKKFQLTSCQFSFHYSFESYEQADLMLRNACECLEVGGYFLGTTPDCYELVKRLRNSETMEFGGEVYKISFKTENKEDFPLYGAKYDFFLEGVVDCPEFLVYFPALEKMAEDYGMRLVYRKNFSQFYKEQIELGDGRGLIGRMQGLEPYPADEDIDLLSKQEGAYEAAEKYLKELQEQQQQNEDDGGRRRRPLKVGTLSQPEWEATTIYCVFLFQKVKDSTAPLLPSSFAAEEGKDAERDAENDAVASSSSASPMKRPTTSEDAPAAKAAKPESS